MQPFRAGLRRFNRQRLQSVRLEVVTLVFRFLGALAHALAGGHHEKRQMVALAVLRRHHVIAQAEEITLPLPLEAESMQRFLRARSEQAQGIHFRLGLEELPDSTNLHELRRFAFHFLHALVQLDRFRFARSKVFFEISPISHVSSIEHERVDVTPDLAQVGHQPHLAVESRNARNQ